MFRRLTLLLIAALLGAVISIVSVSGRLTAQGETVPPPVGAALAAFNHYLSQPITLDQIDGYQLIQGTYNDSALGCTLVAGTPLAGPTTAYRVQIGFQGAVYEFEVSNDLTMIVPCTPQLLTPNVLILVATPTAVVPTIGTTGCPVDYGGYLPPQLTVGGYARIGPDGQPNRMREAPSLDAAQVGLIAPGTTVEVLDGPVCEVASHIVWWQVRDGNLIGYTAESFQADYFLEPVAADALPALPPIREPITATNASGLVTLATVPFENGTALTFGGPGQLLVAGPGSITVYDLNQSTMHAIQTPAGTAVVHLAYSPDGRYIAYSTDTNQLFVYKTTTEQEDSITLDEGTIVNDLDFSADNRLAVAFGDPLGGEESFSGWAVYDLDDETRAVSDPTVRYPTDSWVGDVAFGPAGLRLAWLSDNVNLVLFEDRLPLVSGLLSQPTRTGLAWQPISAPIDPDAAFRLAYADGSTITLFDVQTSDLTVYSNAEDYIPGTLAFNQDGSVLAVLNRSLTDETVVRTLKLFDVESTDPLYTERLDGAREMAVSGDGSLIAVLTDDALRFLGIATAQDAVG